MKRLIFSIVWIAMLALTSLACGTVVEVPSAPVQPDNTPTASVQIVNTGSSPVCYLYISPANAEQWGADQLGDNQQIEPGQTFEFELPVGEAWDFLVEDCNGEQVLLEQGVTLQAGGQYQVEVQPNAVAPTAAVGTASITLRNTSNTRICYVYASPSNSEDYGANLLGNSPISAGSEFTFQIPAGEAYDLQVQNCNEGNLLEEFDITLSAGETRTFDVASAAAPTGSGEIELVNQTPASICNVYIVSASQSGWGDDLFASDLETLLPGQGYAFEVDTGTYNLRAEDCDGKVVSEEFDIQVANGDQLEWSAEGK
ncbi:MAG TPA: hypothetical protein PK299_14110 [Anaerolineales bacterium]|nr:hypothetical protein [Anaerolineales bacterium]